MLKKIAVVALATVMVVAAQATYACDSAKNASATNVNATCGSKDVVKEAKAAGTACASKTAEAKSASACTPAQAAACAKTASAKNCSPEQMANCGKTAGFTNASAQYLCGSSRSQIAQLAPFSFMEAASPAEVHVAVQPTESGFELVFTGVNESNVEQAMMLANKSMEALGRPAACEATRAGMVEKAGGCKTTEECLTALANCAVTMVEVKGGAKTVIASDKAEQVQKLHGMLASVGVAPKAQGDSE